MARPSGRPLRRRRLPGVLAATLAALTLVAGPAAADSYDAQRADAEARATQASQAADAIAATIADLDTKLTQAGLDLQSTQVRLSTAQTALAAAEQTLAQSQREALMIQSRLQDAQAEQSSLTAAITADTTRTSQTHAALGQMARQAYRDQVSATPLSLVLGATSSQDLTDGFAAMSTGLRVQATSLAQLRQVDAQNQNDQARLTAVTELITTLKAQADARLAEARTAQADAAAQQTAITQLLADQQTKAATLAGLKAADEVQQAQIAAERAVISTELAGIIARQRAAQVAAGRSLTCTSGAASSGAGSVGQNLPTSIGRFSGDQVVNAAQVIIAANDLGIDLRGQAIGIMTAIGESGLVNVDHGDTAGPDSRGLFQQRANGAWGSYADRMNPRIAATSFFRALLQVPGWESMTPTLAAHAVQRNANPTYYTPYWSEAVQVVGVLSGFPNLTCQ